MAFDCGSINRAMIYKKNLSSTVLRAGFSVIKFLGASKSGDVSINTFLL